MNAKRSPEDVLRSILEPSSLDEEIEGVLAMTPEQRRAELEAAGVDVKELHAKADALFDATKESPAQPPKGEPAEAKATAAPEAKPAAASVSEGERESESEPSKAAGGTGKDAEVIPLPDPGAQRPVRRRPMAAIVAAGVTAAAAGGVLLAYVGNTQVAAPRPDAPTLRREALDACRDRAWQRCVDKLDEARDVDPDGDRAPEVQAARRAADEALHPRR